MRLREARENAGLLQKEVAERLEISPVTYNRYEQGKREPDVDTLIKLANIFGVTVDYLVGRTDDNEGEEALEALAPITDIPLDDWTDEMKQQLTDFAKFLDSQNKKGK